MRNDSMRRAFLIFFAALTILFIAIAWPFAKAAFLAFTFAMIFSPLYTFLLKKMRLHRYLASLATTLVICACVIAPLAVLSAVFITKIAHFLQEISSQLGQGSLAATFTPLIESAHEWLVRIVGSAPSVEDIRAAIVDGIAVLGKKLYEFSPRVLSTTVTVTANFLFMLLFLVVFLAEGSVLHVWLKETTPLSKEHWDELLRDVRIMISSSIAAALLIAFVQGSLMGIGFWVVGFSQPYGWWLIAIIMSVIPVIGAVSCYLTASVVLMSTGQTNAGLAFLVFGFGIVSTVDNFIRPLIVRGSTRVHPLLLFVTLIGAVRLMGPIGLLVGPVLLSIFLASLRIYRREFASK